MDRRTFLKGTLGASAAAWLRPGIADAALPKARITRIRFFEVPTVMPLEIPLLQSNMVVMIETDANLTGIGEGGTLDTLNPCAGRLIGRNPFEIERLWQDMYQGVSLSARPRAAARDRRDGSRLVGSQGQGTGRAGLRAARRHKPKLPRVLFNHVSRHGGRSANAPRNAWRPAGASSGSTRPAFGAPALTTRVSASARWRRTAARRAPALARQGNFAVDFHQRFTLGRRPRLQADRGARAVPHRRSGADGRVPAGHPNSVSRPRPLAAGEEWGARWDFHRLVENHDLDFVRCSLPTSAASPR